MKRAAACSPQGSEEPACCDLVETGTEARKCPRSSSPGQPVDWRTVAALVAVPVPPVQHFWLCRDPECEVVYFGDRGEVIEQADLRVVPGFKTGSDGLVCYCFLHRRAEIEVEAEATGSSTILDQVKARTRAGECACEVRNPSGRCCLGDLQRHVRLALERRAVG